MSPDNTDNTENTDNIDKIDYQSLFNALYQNTNRMHFVLDEEFSVLAVNKYGAENLGYKVSYMLYQKFINFVHPEHIKNITDQLQLCLSNPGQQMQWVFTMNRADGQIIWVKENAHSIAGNGCANILISCEDITLSKQADQSIDEMMTSYKVESLSRFAGGIAHDFNNLLTGILGNISLIKTNMNLDDSYYEKFVEIENTSIRAKELTEKLSVFSSGGQPYRSVQSVSDLLGQSLESVLKGSQVTYDISREDEINTVSADPEQLKQVFSNIISNSKQAVLGTGQLEIHLKNTAINDKTITPLAEGDYIEISIKDKGYGIATQDLPKVFDPYFTTRPDSAGLGLSIARTIINTHDGHIQIDSEEGIQTTVKIYLPIFKEEEKAAEPQETPEIESDGKLLSGKRVLVMDDEEFIRKVAGNILEHLGCQVEFAREGGEAIEKYRSHVESDSTFDFVILDLTVPEGLGAEDTIKRLKEIDPDVKAIISSGYSHDPVMSNYKDYGFIAMIRKPYEIEDFIKSFCELVAI